MTPFRENVTRVACAVVLAAITVSSAAPPAIAAGQDGTIILAQSTDRDRDRDRDRDWSDADRDRIRDRLRDGSCQEVIDATRDMMRFLDRCMERDRLRDGSCDERIEMGREALQRTRDMCRGS